MKFVFFFLGRKALNSRQKQVGRNICPSIYVLIPIGVPSYLINKMDHNLAQIRMHCNTFRTKKKRSIRRMSSSICRTPYSAPFAARCDFLCVLILNIVYGCAHTHTFKTECMANRLQFLPFGLFHMLDVRSFLLEPHPCLGRRILVHSLRSGFFIMIYGF